MKKILIILLTIITSSCTMHGDHIFRGDIVHVCWTGDVPVFLSKETTQEMAVGLCKKRFGSDTVTWIPGEVCAFGYCSTDNWDRSI